MLSLLEGVSGEDSTVQKRQDDIDAVELEDLEREEYPSGDASFDYGKHQSRDV